MAHTNCIAYDVDQIQEEWFAFRVRPRHEKSVALQLQDKRHRCFLPLVRKTREWGKRKAIVELPLISGYIFCRSHRFGMLSILTTAGVVDVIRAGNTPVAVAEHEISALERALKASLPVAPCAFVEVGQRVTIQSGPLAGVIGIVTDRRKADHVVLSVSLLQRSVLVQIDPSHIAVEGHIFQAAINRSALPSNF